MPRTQTITKTVYGFDELTDDAKERARDWYRSCIDEHDMQFELEDFITIAEIIGISFATHDVKLMSGKTVQKPNIYWSGFSSQGDGACFEGTYQHNADSCAKIREHAPQDTELHRIADELNAVQVAQLMTHGVPLVADIRHTGHYYHEHSVTIELNDDAIVDWVEGAEEQIAELMRDLMRWLYKQLSAENDWLYSAECVDENIRCNDYEFTEGREIA